MTTRRTTWLVVFCCILLVSLCYGYFYRLAWSSMPPPVPLQPAMSVEDPFSEEYNLKYPLIDAGASADVSRVRQLLKQGANPNQKDAHGRTALWWIGGTEFVDLDWVRDTIILLVKHGANINAADKDGMTPLMVAAQHKRLMALKTLLNLGANITKKDKKGRTALDWAKSDPTCTHGYYTWDEVKRLMKAAKPNEKKRNLTTNIDG